MTQTPFVREPDYLRQALQEAMADRLIDNTPGYDPGQVLPVVAIPPKSGVFQVEITNADEIGESKWIAPPFVSPGGALVYHTTAVGGFVEIAFAGEWSGSSPYLQLGGYNILTNSWRGFTDQELAVAKGGSRFVLEVPTGLIGAEVLGYRLFNFGTLTSDYTLWRSIPHQSSAANLTRRPAKKAKKTKKAKKAKKATPGRK